MAYSGKVQRWNPRGFGYISSEDFAEELFCHFTAFGGGDLEEGGTISFDVEDDSKTGGKKCVNVSGPAVMEKDPNRMPPSRRNDSRHESRRDSYDRRERRGGRRDSRDRDRGGRDRRDRYDSRDRYERRRRDDSRDRRDSRDRDYGRDRFVIFVSQSSLYYYSTQYLVHFTVGH